MIDFEQRVAMFQSQVLQAAAAGDVDSAVVVAALADTIGVTAALLDQQTGARSLSDRLDSFVERVRKTYEAQRRRMMGAR